MFGIMGTSAAFAKVAGRGGRKKVNIISFIPTIDDPVIKKLSCSGNIRVSSVKNGESVVETYSNLSNTQVSIQADANSTVVIKGDVTSFENGYYAGWGDQDTVVASSYNFDCSTITSLSCGGKSSYSATSVIENIILNCPNLTTLKCDDAIIASIDLSSCVALTSLSCKFCTRLTALDLSSNTALTSLNCYSCTGLTAIDLSSNTALDTLGCQSCTGLTALDLSSNTALTSLNCQSCTGLTALDLSGSTALTTLNCESCAGLTALDLSHNTALTSLNCKSCTEIISLNASNTALTTLDCKPGNLPKLSTLILANCTELQSIDIKMMSDRSAVLSVIDLTGCDALTAIDTKLGPPISVPFDTLKTLYYAATNQSVTNVLASAITNATAADGTVYTDSQGAYYSTIANAATAKGWTIEQL